MAEITIKKGGVTITASRSDLMEVNETADGVVFAFKGGLQINYMDTFMPAANKQIIKNTADSFGNKKLIFNLDNQKNPAMVDAT